MKFQSYIAIAFLVTNLFGCMHAYREDNKFPFIFNVKTFKQGDNIMFLALSEHSLKNYYFSGIRVDRTDRNCNNSAQTHLTVMWHHYLRKIDIMPLLSSPINYGSYSKGKNLEINVVYSVNIKAKQIYNKQLSGKLGSGQGYFVINNKGNIISAYTYPEIKKLCESYNK